jgi:hypothetical protein
MYAIASAIIALSSGASAALILETTRRRVAGVRLERDLRRPGAR